MKVAIMTDTSSGFTVQDAKDLGIYLIHIPIIIDGETFYEEKNLVKEELFDAFKSGKNISTSQPSIGDMMDLWENIFADGYDEIVYIPMSSGISNSYGTSMKLAQNYENKIQIVNNYRVSVVLKDSVLSAKKLANQGMSAKEIKNALEKDAKNFLAYMAVGSLEHLRKSGRLSSFATVIGSMLSIKPIVIFKDSKISFFTKIRGNMNKCGLKIIDIVKNDLKKLSKESLSKLRVAMVGINLSESEKLEWINTLKKMFPSSIHTYYDSIPASMICHLGPIALGIGACFS